MKKINNVVTAQKSIEEMQKEVNVFNEKMKPINDWLKEEKRKRIVIAQHSSNHDNTICPICGKEIQIRERCNGTPLVDACVCGECDKRYVFPFRISPLNVSDAPSMLKHYMDAELMIEMAKKIKSLSANHTDVA